MIIVSINAVARVPGEGQFLPPHMYICHAISTPHDP